MVVQHPCLDAVIQAEVGPAAPINTDNCDPTGPEGEKSGKTFFKVPVSHHDAFYNHPVQNHVVFQKTVRQFLYHAGAHYGPDCQIPKLGSTFSVRAFKNANILVQNKALCHYPS